MPRARSVSAALSAALKVTKTDPQDQAATALATRYAQAIDKNPDLLWRLGPRLLETLMELGMTPRARSAVMAVTPDDNAGAPSKLDELRERRRARRTPHLDQAPPAVDA